MRITSFYQRMETRALLKDAAKYLHQYGVAFSEREAASILMDLLGLSSYSQLSDVPYVSEKIIEAYQKRLKLRGEKRCPTAYLHGSVSFLGLSLNIDSRVLIPRMETELLAERVITYISSHPEIQVVYDVCCGSGCIGLAIKNACPQVQVVLSDISPKAVAVAKENARNTRLDVEVYLGDLFEPYSSPGDAFVCNPPYLSYKEVIRTDPEVHCHEPWQALVGGATGVEFYKRIAQELPKVLRPRGVGWLEIGYTQGSQVKDIFLRQGISGEIQQDFAGWDRFFFLEMDF